MNTVGPADPSAIARRSYDAAAPVFFLHIPKAAGTSLSDALAAWFPGRMHHHYRPARGERPPLHEVGPGDCVGGHFNRLRGFGLYDSYPSASQYFTMLRDPFDRCVSQWLVRWSQGTPLAPTFEAWLEIRRRAFDEGADDFSFLAHLPNAPPGGDLASVFHGDCLAVGLAERYEDSVDLFANVLGKARPVEVKHLNVTGTEKTEFEPLRKLYRSAFPLEYAVYEEARRNFEQASMEYS